MSQRKKIVVIGGSAAGPKAAAKARRLDENAEIIIVQREPELSMASCGYPYYVGGFFDDRNQLLCTPAGVVRDEMFYAKAKGITAKTQTEAIGIDRAAKTVTVKDLQTGKEEILAYDKLILATGATARRPPIPGIELKGITTLQSMRDADYLRKIRDEKQVKRAVVIGGGLIGVETCEALVVSGIETTVVELLPQLLVFLDWQLAKVVENHVKSKGARVISDNGIAGFFGKDGVLTGVKLQKGDEIPCELAVLAIGVAPNSKLAKDAGLEIGKTGGIIVNSYMRTSDAHIYAVGDCIESTHLISHAHIHAPLGDLANLQGRAAGENAILGDTVSFPGTIQTGICKVFDFSAGSTGLSEKAAVAAGFEVETVVNSGPDKPGFMGGKLLITKLTADKKTGRILGAQCVGPGDVSRQIATWAIAITGKLTVEDMVNADLPYAPPFSLAIDHSIATAHVLQNKIKGRMKGISAAAVKEKLDAGRKMFLIDVRSPQEYEEMRLGVGEKLIPIGKFRDSLNDIPQDKDAEIICFCKVSLRGYEAECILEGRGWRNVRVMEGGVAAWPYPREK